MLTRRDLLTLAPGAALWLAGCGGGKRGGPTDPSSVLPGRYLVVASEDGSDALDRDRLTFPVTISVVPLEPGRWRVEVAAGPLDRDYKAVSVPLEPFVGHGDYCFDNGISSHQVGCDNAFDARSGACGRAGDIPLRCRIMGTPDSSGLARAPGAAWVELVGSGQRLRRTPISGDWREVWAVRNSSFFGGTALVAEVSFQREPISSQAPRPKGAILRLVEEITVVEA